jgi:predicted Zn finger-like uncharacterized protein
MIAVCPKCSARYRVDTARLGPEGARLRCTKCQALFLVRVPTAGAGAAPSTPVAATAPSTPVRAAAAPPSVAADPALLVVVADPDEARGKATAEALRSWGVGAHLVHDGVEAMLAIQRLMPRAVVLDAALPRMYGFQVCEIVKRNPSLRHMTVVLVGAVHDANRYRRDPSELYGADLYLESPDLPDGLRPLLAGMGAAAAAPAAPVPAAAARPMPTPVAAPTPARAAASPPPLPHPPQAAAQSPSVAPSGPAPGSAMGLGASSAAGASGSPSRDEERERARRLARIAVSEMLLYQPEKFAQAAREGTLEKLLELEIQEARALLRQRIGPEVRAEGDFVLEELHRVARERGAKA